ncbi:hypothetical protein [Nonomuraea helvata]|uniref:Cation/H+ exchanger domain-containing protein n=1 Tax=Nonomuraea helvata TaxID=37484 RepID=A0ABV5SMT7_9ACTN
MRVDRPMEETEQRLLPAPARGLVLALVLTAVAVLGKLGTASVVALAGGMPRRLALGLGVLMNARGVTEIVVLSTGLSVGVFAMLVLMALVTTVMAVPALRLLKLFNPAGPPSGPEQHHAATSGVTISGKERLS